MYFNGADSHHRPATPERRGMGLFRRQKKIEHEGEECPRCGERIAEGADECAMCGLDLKPFLPAVARHQWKTPPRAS